ncbi:PREDICTED: endoribonuclease Dcr-1 [Polistes dominula]|uniref:Endoribonuclease Dcr-1 n=1 Tax=Polistes dominula TaxID=743375 RepID=A0ABM1IYK5_POLDO|nr:PREDICTED: endoribonuclease Dcr-1 [Polistes dominula]XP_015185293.1 PREDICTED: endoribonuclease Dcr-1 [Polistes dominula]
MAFFPLNDQIHIKSFTPREYQVEIFYEGKQNNIIFCLESNYDQLFIALKLVQEYATNNRSVNGKKKKHIIYMISDIERCRLRTVYVTEFTDIKALFLDECTNLPKEVPNYTVLIGTPKICLHLFKKKILAGYDVCLLIIDNCHKFIKDKTVGAIVRKFAFGINGPRIIGIAVPLYNLTLEPGRLGVEIYRAERAFRCKLESNSEIISILRYCPKPKEYLIEYGKGKLDELSKRMEGCVLDARDFLQDHRFDPFEIYDESYIEDIKKMADPTIKPRQIIEEFLLILRNLGAWCADRAAYYLLILIEKLKVSTPYERNFLLLNILTTTFTKIRAIFHYELEHYEKDDMAYKFSTPKIHRVLDVLNIYTPFYSRYKDIIDTMRTVVPKETAKGKKQADDVRRRAYRTQRYLRGIMDPDLLCGIIFVKKSFTAKVIASFLNDVSKYDDRFSFITCLHLIESNSDDFGYFKDVEIQLKKQEEVLKKFRMHECNLLVATKILEEGIDIPKCNLVLRYDFPKEYQSYVQCKTKARAVDPIHVLLLPKISAKRLIWKFALFGATEKKLISKTTSYEPSDEEEREADMYADMIPHFQPLDTPGAVKVTFNSAISLINKYCAKLPSDTFTRLTPEWIINPVKIENSTYYECSLRLPINSPLKYVITSYPMPNKAMARRMAALQYCIELHRKDELDDNLLPIGKENFKAKPEDAELPALPDETELDEIEARPGTTKRRQYYDKKTAKVLTECRPTAGSEAYLYHINMVLNCPLPEEQNTRGRKIYPPEESSIGFGILTLKKIPKLCPFPIYTRSGEVHVNLELSKKTIVLTETQIERIAIFLKYTFTNVLRLQKYLMYFDMDISEDSYIIVPIKLAAERKNSDINIDWDFLDCIYDNQDTFPAEVPEKKRKEFKFDSSKYNDAVIMPWYRSQDQPQYFYVAEICTNLNPKSAFPGDDYISFEEYYLKKYNVQIQNLEQPLLDVDHTSARLNFLTPRYVNRKGVALPTSSEETKRAKRENLEQKQILVPELCVIHPFPASLWRQAVCLPCILYRINALLLADQIRCEVAQTINLGKANLKPDFEWPPLNFGWSLAEVLKKSKEAEKEKLQASTTKLPILEQEDSIDVSDFEEDFHPHSSDKQDDIQPKKDDIQPKKDDELEIGVWSNDMVTDDMKLLDESFFPIGHIIKWDITELQLGHSEASRKADSISDSASNVSDNSDNENTGLRISYMSANTAEAVEDPEQIRIRERNKEMLAVLEKERKIFMDQYWIYVEGSGGGLLRKHAQELYDEAAKIRRIFMKSEYYIPMQKETKVSRKRDKAEADTIHENLPGEKKSYKHKDYISNIVEKFNNEILTTDYVKPPMKKETKVEITYIKDNDLFSFDFQPELKDHPGPSPSLILQALTMSNANDGINLERLETIGDSFLKYAITTYLYCTYENIHEGKLSHLRSKHVSNLNLYRLGKKKELGENMIATKFEPHDNWLPPCYYVPKELEQSMIQTNVTSEKWSRPSTPTESDLVDADEQELALIKDEFSSEKKKKKKDNLPQYMPYNLITQHSIPDKSIADCVEALIGAYLIACGPRGALLFMTWLGIHVLPSEEICVVQKNKPKDDFEPGTTPYEKKITEDRKTTWVRIKYGKLEEPQNLLNTYIPNMETELQTMLDGYDELEKSIGYKFNNVSYLLQAFTHASYQLNNLTDCYQRLEFLGDAVLDYLITRHLYEDARQHSPGALTDLRSALVNNTIFASLAVRCGFHKYFRHLSPGLNIVINRFVRIQEANGHSISEEYYLIGGSEFEEAEDIEVPKALGDVFESLAGAIYLDSGMSLDAVWSVYYNIMKTEIELFSINVPKSPIRELLELEPETAKFGNPEKLADGRRVRVTVDVINKGVFKGIGRNYRIAKCTAAKCALKQLKKNFPKSGGY